MGLYRPWLQKLTHILLDIEYAKYWLDFIREVIGLVTDKTCNITLTENENGHILPTKKKLRSYRKMGCSNMGLCLVCLGNNKKRVALQNSNRQSPKYLVQYP